VVIRVLSSVWFWMTVFIAVVGFAGGFLPRVTITASDPVDPAYPLLCVVHINQHRYPNAG
jgi:hypothetical protein